MHSSGAYLRAKSAALRALEPPQLDACFSNREIKVLYFLRNRKDVSYSGVFQRVLADAAQFSLRQNIDLATSTTYIIPEYTIDT